MIIPITVRHPLPAWPRCLLIILWSAQPEALSTLSLLPFWPTNHSSRYFMHALERLTTFDVIIEWTVFFSFCLSVFFTSALYPVYWTTPPTHPIFSILTPPSCPSPFKTFPSQPLVYTSTNIPPSLSSYLRRRCWIPAAIWRSQKWSVAGPWSSHTGRH